MKTMPGYRVIASYTQHGDRFYHAADTQRTGPSINSAAFYRGERPAPLVAIQAPTPRPQVEYYPAPDVGRLVTQVQQGQPLPPLTPPQPTINHQACPTCTHLPCTCGVPRPPTWADIEAVQRAQGKR